jgi:hypothetical protein
MANNDTGRIYRLGHLKGNSELGLDGGGHALKCIKNYFEEKGHFIANRYRKRFLGLELFRCGFWAHIGYSLMKCLVLW